MSWTGPMISDWSRGPGPRFLIGVVYLVDDSHTAGTFCRVVVEVVYRVHDFRTVSQRSTAQSTIGFTGGCRLHGYNHVSHMQEVVYPVHDFDHFKNPKNPSFCLHSQIPFFPSSLPLSFSLLPSYIFPLFISNFLFLISLFIFPLPNSFSLPISNFLFLSSSFLFVSSSFLFLFHSPSQFQIFSSSLPLFTFPPPQNTK